ncbi:MAG: sortase [Acutalibacteraceae bacterium]
MLEQQHAQNAANSTLEQLIPQISAANDGEADADYKQNPSVDMPEIKIDGYDYIGILAIPRQKLRLPVASGWSNSAAKVALCRYDGSAYLDNLIIAGHNYSGFFSGLKSLNIGDEVTFTDANGNIFNYKVADMEILAAEDVDKMTSGGWPLTLFTCTVGGQSRIAVRCEYA